MECILRVLFPLTSHGPIPSVAERPRGLREAVHFEALFAAGAVLLGGFEVVALCPRVSVVRRSQGVLCCKRNTEGESSVVTPNTLTVGKTLSPVLLAKEHEEIEGIRDDSCNVNQFMPMLLKG